MKQKKRGRYWPLLVLVAITVLAATALNYGAQKGLGAWMHYFMGIFLCQFALLKLFDPSGFANGFQMYDLIAKKSRTYAYLYPLVELVLGLSYLSFVYPTAVYIITICVMAIGTIGVIQALRKDLNVRCACMGTILDVPLSNVTLSEDILMAIMACLMLYMQKV